MARRVAITTTLPGEEWRDIPSAPGYRASSFGRLKGPQRSVLKPRIYDGGYLRLCIYIEGRPVTRGVAGLVCEAFHGPKPSDAHQPAHGDGVKSNNRSSNLRWATPKQNQEDRKAHGTRCIGQNHGMAKITDAQADEIRAAYRQGQSGSRIRRGLRQELAIRYGIAPSTVGDIGNGKDRAIFE